MTATVTLRLVEGRLDRTEYVFDERTVCVVGRAPECAPRLPDDEYHRTVSRHHCLLDLNPPVARIRDFGSRNGTYVNGEKIGQREEQDLVHGDEIRLGKTVFRVEVRVPTGYPTLPPAQSGPGAVAEHLVELAHTGRRELAPIAGYALLRELGRGGMGAAYLARHEDTGREVALKVMLPRVAASTTARARFFREIALTRTLRHPNIATQYDTGVADGTFFFTTEYCAGGSLDQLLDHRGGRLDTAGTVRLAVQALAGLSYAHGEGVVHRDLSPHNILLGEADGSPVAKIGDFGLAKAFDLAGLSGLTRTGATAGKPWFLPRQQVVNFRNATPAVDVWALAACVYHALTGRYPRDFPPDTDPWQVILQADPVPIRHREPGVDKELATVIDEALREEPEIGFQTADDLRHALLAL